MRIKKYRKVGDVWEAYFVQDSEAKPWQERDRYHWEQEIDGCSGYWAEDDPSSREPEFIASEGMLEIANKIIEKAYGSGEITTKSEIPAN